MVSLKPPTTPTEQIDRLRALGMKVDEDEARKWLSSVSYYRLSGYWYTYRILSPTSDPKNPMRLDGFQPGTTFSEVAALYEFDRKLRTLVHDGMERIEVAMRARVGELLVEHGPLAYQEPSRFRAQFDHARWLQDASKRVGRAEKRSQSIQHYNKKYGDYPFWVLAEVLDFSDISRLYEGLNPADQHRIAKTFGLDVDLVALTPGQRRKYYKADPLVRWCEQLTVLRNICAHHGRTWNRYLTPASTHAFRTIDDLRGLPEGESGRVFGALLVMSFLLRSISPGTTWPNKVRSLIENDYLSLSSRSIEDMGMDSGWDTSPLWSLNNQ